LFLRLLLQLLTLVKWHIFVSAASDVDPEDGRAGGCS